ncbi:MAG: hypothetical protein U0075_16505 [Thermomicrobiales bacterium]
MVGNTTAGRHKKMAPLFQATILSTNAAAAIDHAADPIWSPNRRANLNPGPVSNPTAAMASPKNAYFY